MSNSSSDTLLFVRGIPIDLTRESLANLFNRAEPIKNACLIPPKNSSYTSTFGFVEFSTRTTAAVFLERTSTTTLCSMFDYDYDYDRCATSHDQKKAVKTHFYSFFWSTGAEKFWSRNKMDTTTLNCLWCSTFINQSIKGFIIKRFFIFKSMKTAVLKLESKRLGRSK
ncbi:hypothetical protein BpHYR1_046535 [Brachionus plicatilis]|uniref:RRM domain-containing protein n=1 Tax=Brachionus plicatilis TaxID=10195 RepID=A0A3M7P928_BRAPC|nr:hypothetical protein BpHYR1_046535 [Brachionus plicatilis]